MIEYENANKKGQGLQVNLQRNGSSSGLQPDSARESIKSRQSGVGPARFQQLVAGQTDRDLSPDESMRTTINSFGTITPSSNVHNRRFREIEPGNSTFYSQASRQWDQRNSEVRLSNKSELI